MSEHHTEELPELPEDFRVEPPESRSEPRTRSVRRPAKGRQTSGPQKPPRPRQKTRPPASSRTNVVEAIRGILQMPATAMIVVGQRTGSVPLVADGATILVHGPMLANAIEDVANHDPRVMAMLEKLISFGPYSALVMATIVIGAQFTMNHEAAPAQILEGFGAVPPENIIAQASLEVPAGYSPNGKADNVPPPAE